MAAGDLVDSAAALSWLGSADPANIVPLCISAVSASIQKWIGYQIALSNYTKTFNGRGGARLLLPDRPVMAVTAVTVDGVTIPASTGPTAPGFVSDDLGVFLRCYEFTRGVQNVVVSYSAGYTTVPADIQAACLAWLAQVFSNAGENPAISAYRAGDTEIDYGAATTEIGNMTALIPPQVASAILPYRRVSTP